MSPVKFAILLIAEGPWRRLNSNQMCFGAGDKQSGGFVVEVDGLIDAVKLVHLYGQVSCDVSNGRWSKWGCGAKKLNGVFNELHRRYPNTQGRGRQIQIQN